MLGFVEGLRKRLAPVPVVTARRASHDGRGGASGCARRASGWKERKRVVDQVAAVVILQEYLDDRSGGARAVKAGA